MDLKKMLESLLNKNKKNSLINLTIIALIAILIVIGTNIFKSTGSSETNDTSKNQAVQRISKTSDDFEIAMENKLKATLEKIDGVGRVDVMITFESGEEQVPAINVNNSTNTTEEKDGAGGTRTSTQKTNGSNIVITNDGAKNEPLIVKTYKPKVIGVCVVAEGAESKVTELMISKAVVNLFNLSMDKVNVYPMKK